MTLTEKVYTHLDMVLADAINKTLEDEDSVTADTKIVCIKRTLSSAYHRKVSYIF